MANWFKNSKTKTIVQPYLRQESGRALIYIDNKPYWYINVPEPAFYQLQRYAEVGNLQKAFQIIKSLELDPNFREKEKVPENRPTQLSLF